MKFIKLIFLFEKLKKMFIINFCIFKINNFINIKYNFMSIAFYNYLFLLFKRNF